MIDDENFYIIFGIISSLLYGAVQILVQVKNKSVLSKSLNNPELHPYASCQILQKIYETFLGHQNNPKDYLELLGLLENHQDDCTDITCPCLYVDEVKMKQDIELEREREMLLSEQEKQEKRCLIVAKIKTKGNYLFEIANDYTKFQKFIMDFIDHHLMKLLDSLQQSKSSEINSQISIVFWFFLCKNKGNYIKGLFMSKQSLMQIRNPPLQFLIIERALTSIIENEIKQKDKANMYSFKLKESDNAKMFIRFENLVNSEVSIQAIKQQTSKVIEQKMDWLQKLIEGHSSYDPFQKETISLLNMTNKLENDINKFIQQNPGNIHYPKILSLIRARIYSDPMIANRMDQQIFDIKRKDALLDKNTINSLNILAGNVGSIIASFRTFRDQGKILGFSTRTPQIFGYDQQSFKALSSMKELVPDVISVHHDLFIKRLIQTGKPNIMRSYRIALAKLRSGILQEVKLYVNYYFMISNEFAFSALCLKSTTSQRLVLVDQLGYIHGFNKEFAEFIEFHNEVGFLEGAHINLFIPTFTDFLRSLQNDPGMDLQYLKFQFNFPSKSGLEEYISDFKKHHSEIKNREFKSKREKFKESFEDVEDYVYSQCKALGHMPTGSPRYDAVCNVLREQIDLITGEQFNAYIIMIDQTVYIDDFRSTSGMSTNMAHTQAMSSAKKSPANQSMWKPLDFGDEEDNKQNHLIAQNLELGVDSTIQKVSNLQSSTHQNEFQQTPIDEIPLIPDSSHQANQENDELKSPNNEKKGKTVSMKSQFQSENKTQFNVEESQPMNEYEQEPDQDQNGKDASTDLNDSDMHNSVSNYENDHAMNKQFNHNNVEGGDDEFVENEMAGREDQSVSSSVGSIEVGTIKQISGIATSKEWPNELRMLYCSFLLQLFLFVIIVILLIISFREHFQGLTDCISQLQLIVRITVPPSSVLLSTQFQNLINMGYTFNDGSMVQSQQLKTDLIDFFNEQRVQENLNYGDIFNQLLRKEIVYDHQELILSEKLNKLYIKTDSTFTRSTFPLTEYIRLNINSVYDLSFKENVETLDALCGTIYNDISYFLVNNILNLFKSLQKVHTKIGEDLQSLENSINDTNTRSLIISLLLIISSFIIIIPGFTNMKRRIERICQVVSRITESEAEHESQCLDTLKGHLMSYEESFLMCKYTNYHSINKKQAKYGKNSSRNKIKAKKTNSYLNERIHNQSLNYILVYVMMFLLFVLSGIFFTVIFIYIGNYEEIYIPAIKDQTQFYKSSSQFAMMIMAHRVSLLSYLNNPPQETKYFINDNILKEYNSLKAEFQKESQRFYTEDFLLIGMNSIYSQEFRDKFTKITSENVCNNEDIIESYQKKLCIDSRNGDLTRGFSLALKTAYNAISNQDFKELGQGQVNEYIRSKEFVDDSVINNLSLSIFYSFCEIFLEENRILTNTFLDNLYFIYIIGSLVYFILFVILVIYYLTKLVDEYMKMKQGIQLIPYKRLSEDQTTHHLLKRIFNL